MLCGKGVWGHNAAQFPQSYNRFWRVITPADDALKHNLTQPGAKAGCFDMGVKIMLTISYAGCNAAAKQQLDRTPINADLASNVLTY